MRKHEMWVFAIYDILGREVEPERCWCGYAWPCVFANDALTDDDREWLDGHLLMTIPGATVRAYGTANDESRSVA